MNKNWLEEAKDIIDDINACVEEFDIKDAFSDKGKTHLDVLIVKSAKDSILKEFMNYSGNELPMCKFTVIGDLVDNSIKEDENIVKIVEKTGRFSAEDGEKDYQYLSEKYDAIIYLGYFKNKESYLNVEEYCYALQNHIKTSVYNYISSEKKLYKYSKLKQHILGIKCYCSYVRYIEAWLEDKDENRI